MSAAAPTPKENMGKPEPRLDAEAKVTGVARYPSDVAVPNPAYAYLVTSAIAKGKIATLDTADAKAVPGVIDIFTHENTQELKKVKYSASGGGSSTSIQESGPDILHDGQIIAMVVADSFEVAREAAYRVKATYNREQPSATFGSQGLREQSDPLSLLTGINEWVKTGNADKALEGAEVSIDEHYGTPTQHHNAMELFTTTCSWDGDKLTVYEPSQFVYGLKNVLAEKLGIKPDNVHIISPFVGGAFGSKAQMTPRTGLVALAARKLNRPVKLVATRDQGFTIATYRAETQHHIRLGASRDGKFVGYSHEGVEISSRPDTYKVAGTEDTAHLYAYGTVSTNVTVLHADRNTPGFMRSPPVVPYVFALESAVDELAFRLGIDPVELRRINDTMVDPIDGDKKPYSSRSLMACYDQAAEAFGWKDRKREPSSMRDGDWLIGWGCATAVYPTHFAPSTARVRMLPSGQVRVQTAAHDLGTGAYTVIGQMAAERLGVPLSAVTVELGDTSLPPAIVAGGSVTTGSVCSAVLKACDAIREKLLQSAINAGPFAGRRMSDLNLTDGRAVATDGSAVTMEDLTGRTGGIEEYAEFIPEGMSSSNIKKLYDGQASLGGGSHGKKLMYAFGAEFVEVRVHARTKEVRVPRAVGAFAAGRIMNTRTAHSQLMGGMIWGIGSALHEATEIDKREARYINDNLADYLIPVNADVPQIDVILVSETDNEVNPAGVKGLGELGNVGTAAAVANAVFHATGTRLRDLPIRLEQLLV
jgi:xanthine dehydrogenase YagR molybdenum-binding subunit